MSKIVKKRMRFRWRFVGYIIILIIVLAISFYYKNLNNNLTGDFFVTSGDRVINVADHYAEFVSTVNDSNIYEHVAGRYVAIGTIEVGTPLILDSIEPSNENLYFKIDNSDYYVRCFDVRPTDSIVIDEHYKNYLVFNKNIVTNSKFSLYLDGKKDISFNLSLEFPVVMIEAEEYYVEFNNRLMAIRKDEVNREMGVMNSNLQESTSIAVLNYHFFNDSTKEVCNEMICLEKKVFESHLKYLKDNGFYTVTMSDLNLWMDKKIRLPKKSVLITVDDGAMGTDTHLIELLEKYNMRGTLFLITAWWPKTKYQSPNLEIQSHGDNLHAYGKCGKTSIGQCLTKDELIKDLNKSKSKLDRPIAFCYPFYAYNNTMIDALRETGFELAFVDGDKKVKQSDNKYLVPRYVIYKWYQVSDISKFVN